MRLSKSILEPFIKQIVGIIIVSLQIVVCVPVSPFKADRPGKFNPGARTFTAQAMSPRLAAATFTEENQPPAHREINRRATKFGLDEERPVGLKTKITNGKQVKLPSGQIGILIHVNDGQGRVIIKIDGKERKFNGQMVAPQLQLAPTKAKSFKIPKSKRAIISRADRLRRMTEKLDSALDGLPAGRYGPTALRGIAQISPDDIKAIDWRKRLDLANQRRAEAGRTDWLEPALSTEGRRDAARQHIEQTVEKIEGRKTMKQIADLAQVDLQTLYHHDVHAMIENENRERVETNSPQKLIILPRDVETAIRQTLRELTGWARLARIAAVADLELGSIRKYIQSSWVDMENLWRWFHNPDALPVHLDTPRNRLSAIDAALAVREGQWQIAEIIHETDIPRDFILKHYGPIMRQINRARKSIGSSRQPLLPPAAGWQSRIQNFEAEGWITLARTAELLDITLNSAKSILIRHKPRRERYSSHMLNLYKIEDLPLIAELLGRRLPTRARTLLIRRDYTVQLQSHA